MSMVSRRWDNALLRVAEYLIQSLQTQMIKRNREAGVVRPYYPNLASRIKSLLGRKSRGRRESGLYLRGHGSKSIFWYWEINYELGHYQEFKAVNLSEGKEIYREERFDLWDRR